MAPALTRALRSGAFHLVARGTHAQFLRERAPRADVVKARGLKGCERRETGDRVIG